MCILHETLPKTKFKKSNNQSKKTQTPKCVYLFTINQVKYIILMIKNLALVNMKKRRCKSNNRHALLVNSDQKRGAKREKTKHNVNETDASTRWIIIDICKDDTDINPDISY